MSRRPERTIALTLFVVTAAAYVVTAYPSVGPRNAGETAVVAHTMGVAHAPGYGLLMLAYKTGSMIPVANDIAHRMNVFSALISAISVSLAYIVIANLISRTLRDDRRTDMHLLLVHGGGTIGALTLAFGDTFWSNATLCTPANPTVLLTLAIAWSFLRWHDGFSDGSPMLGFLFGVAAGLSGLLLTLVVPVAFLAFRRRVGSSVLLIAGSVLASLAVFLVLYLGVSTWLPAILAIVNPDMKAFSGLAVVYAAGLAAAGTVLALPRMDPGRKRSALVAALLIIGISANLVIPLRASQKPGVNAGAPATAAEYASYQSAGTFAGPGSVLDRLRDDMNAAGLSDGRNLSPGTSALDWLKAGMMRPLFWNYVGRSSGSADAIPAFPGLSDSESGDGASPFPKHYYAVPFLAGFVGLFRLLRTSPATGLFILTAFILVLILPIFAGHSHFSGIPDDDGREVIPVALFALCVGVGTAATARWMRGVSGRTGSAILAMLVMVFLGPANMIRLNAADHANGGDYTTPDLAYNQIQSCDSTAVQFTEGNDDTYPLLYLQLALGIRRDVRVVNRTLLNAAWYSRECLKPANGGSAPAVVSGFTDRDVRLLSEPGTYSLERTGWLSDRKEIRVPVPKRIMKGFAKERMRYGRQPMDSLLKEKLPTEMMYYGRAEYPVALDSAGETIRYLRRWRDVMIEDILRTAAWKRPVYVSVTCDREAFSAMEDYLRLEGLAWRITPITNSDEPYLLRHAVREHLFQPVVRMSAERKRGFLHRSSFPSGFVNPEVAGLAVNYRNVYLRYAEHMLRFDDDRAAAARTLRAMAAKFPRVIFPMDNRYLYDVAVLYRRTGATATWRALRSVLVAGFRDEIRRQADGVTGVHSPYRYLLDIYQQDRDYDRALAVLDEMQQRAPHAEDIRARREELLQERLNSNTQ